MHITNPITLVIGHFELDNQNVELLFRKAHGQKGPFAENNDQPLPGSKNSFRLSCHRAVVSLGLKARALCLLDKPKLGV